MNSYAYLIMRLAVAASMFGHGLVRLPKLSAFSGWMVDSFKDSLLPQILVTPFSYVLPVAEFTIGLLLLLGLFTRQAAIAGGFTMMLLIFGSCLTEHWDFVPSQLLHVAFFTLVLQFIATNSFALDRRIKPE